MTDDTTITTEVVEATAEDVAYILAWLRREHDEDGERFWCNRNLIADSVNTPGDIWVIRDDGKAVAFQLGRYSASILSVRKEYRKRGVGTALVEASVKRALEDEVNALHVQCEPKKSLGFWQRMGFVRYGDLEPDSNVTAYRLLPRCFDVPIAASHVNVVIGFYPESAIYGDAMDVAPIAESQVAGFYTDDGSIILAQRVIGLSHYGGQSRDTVVKIEIEGVVHCFCKAKYDDARAIGVKHDWSGDAYFIDRLNPSNSEE